MLLVAQLLASLAPEDTAVEAVEYGDGELREYAASEKEFRVDSTGAKVTLRSAKPLIYEYCKKLPSDM